MSSPAALLHEAQILIDHLKRLEYRWECERDDCDGLPHEGWLHNHARASQREPDGYRTWALITGRGFGKTRTGAETVKKWAEEGARHIAVVAKTDREVRSICFEGPAGLLDVFHPDDVLVYNKGAGSTRLVLKNGCLITAFTAESPDNLRGYAFDGAWCDEFAAWPRQTAQSVMDMLWFCLREAQDPRIIVTTTPKPVEHVKALIERSKTDPKVHITTGSTLENYANLSDAALEELKAAYAGTRLGRQELEGEFLEDVEGALWTYALIDATRVRELPNDDQIARVVVAIDPAITSGEKSDETGIVTAALTKDGHIYILSDATMKGSPDAWARAAVLEYERVGADCIVVEANQGGDSWKTIIGTVAPNIRVKKVHATSGKRLRAEPVSALYEQAKVHHVGVFPELEAQLVTWTPFDPSSPDRMDALVWAVTELAFKRQAAPVQTFRT